MSEKISLDSSEIIHKNRAKISNLNETYNTKKLMPVIPKK